MVTALNCKSEVSYSSLMHGLYTMVVWWWNVTLLSCIINLRLVVQILCRASTPYAGVVVARYTALLCQLVMAAIKHQKRAQVADKNEEL